jgi:hypothetical protein
MPMMANKVAIVASTIFTAAFSMADSTSFNITSAKTGFIDEGSLYVSAGYPENHDRFQEPLKALWDQAGIDIRTDDYGQPWREVSIADIKKVFGSVDTLYLAVFDEEVYPHEAKRAFIWRWGCDEFSLVPVLDLGSHKFKKEPWEWAVDVLGVTSLPDKLKARHIDSSFIPPEFYNPLSSPGGWDLWVNGERRFSYIERNEDHNVTPENLLLDHDAGEQRIIVEKSPLDVRC